MHSMQDIYRHHKTANACDFVLAEMCPASYRVFHLTSALIVHTLTVRVRSETSATEIIPPSMKNP